MDEDKPSEPAAAPAPSFAIGLASTAADEEVKKRAERAKRFGLEEDADATKRAERARRFGLDEKAIASGLDSALPERSLRRGRARGQGQGQGQEHDGRINKRQGGQDRRTGGRRQGRGGRGGGGSRRDAGPIRNVLSDPVEKAKAEKRAARFATN